uniref:Peptidase_M1 domain-containing protein n=1 Tax=Heligmosomoides polygyrus TaxID=6339 RepID=A0A183FJM6_HELPZ
LGKSRIARISCLRYAAVRRFQTILGSFPSLITERVMCVLSPSAFSPFHYALNLTVQTVMPTVIEGDLQLYLRITLDVDSKLRNVEDIHVVNCDTGEFVGAAFYEPPSGQVVLRIERWNRNAPIMVGTLLTPGSAKRLFPGMENPTTMDLCVRYTPAGHVRSNAATKFVAGVVTCFERTAPLATQQFAFAGFEKTLIYNRTALDGIEIPAVEIVFSLNKNFKREKHAWIYSEASKIISLMTQWTGYSYPLEALRIISAPIRASSHSSLGLITLQHPSYTLAHVTLIHSIIQQWLSGVVSLAKAEEMCFESLTTYLEWKVNEELNIVNKTVTNEIESIRPHDLTKEGKDDMRMLRSLEMIHACPERLISIFYTIDETFGRDTIKSILKYMFRNFAYKATTISDWQQAATEVTGNGHAGQMLAEWFTRKTRPVLHLAVSANDIQFEQMTDDLWTVPVEIAGSTGIQLVAVTEKSTKLPYSSNDYVIADPRRKSAAMIVYDADSYIRMIRCWDDTRCPANHDALRGIVRDLVAVLLTDRIEPPVLMDIPKWKALFKFSRNNRILAGDAACCAQYAISRTAEIACTWVVRDTCEKIRLFNTLANSDL